MLRHSIFNAHKLLLLLIIVLFSSFQAVVASEAAHEGTWTKFKAKTKGSWSITVEGDKRYINFNDEFKTKRAPDLKIVLSPKPLANITNRNALDGSVIISLLTSYSGAQRFEIPQDVNLEDYQTLLIHCEKFTYVWSGGSLNI